MNKHELISQRSHQQWPSWFVVYEWEDIISEVLGFEIRKDANIVIRKIRYYGWRQYKWFSKFSYNDRDWSLIWVMNSKYLGEYTYRGAIPIFLDTPLYTLNEVYKATRNLPCFWVTCYDFYLRLINMGAKNAYYMPLSISDQHISKDLPRKTIDVLQFGRKNKYLHDWMLQYCEEHPETEYVYQTDNGTLSYVSTTRGDLGKFDSRDNYIGMLKNSKVSLVSSPGYDHTRDFGGIDFITPRFYESIACYCYLIGRYTENQETNLLNLKTLCPNIIDYQNFNETLTNILNRKNFVFYDCYQKFFAQNCTSQRAEEIMHVLKKEGLL